jgi:hypothetical protein
MRESTGHIDTVAANVEIEAAAVSNEVRIIAMTATILLPPGGAFEKPEYSKNEKVRG